MTIWFSTNIPEMRAISTFNRVSTDISEIQHRITTGQRINSGKDDPGGLIIRERLRADIKSIHATQANMMQAENLMNTAAGGISQLIEILQGSDPNDPSGGGWIRMLEDPGLTTAQKDAAGADFALLFASVLNTTKYNNELLLGGAIAGRQYQLGDGAGTLDVTIAQISPLGGSSDVATLTTALDTLSTAAGELGLKQQIVGMNQRLLDSRLTSVTAAEGRISNADIAVESSRMARAELLAQNSMNSIMYTRSFAAFSVSSLFR